MDPVLGCQHHYRLTVDMSHPGDPGSDVVEGDSLPGQVRSAELDVSSHDLLFL
jgi:hypothetical protein